MIRYSLQFIKENNYLTTWLTVILTSLVIAGGISHENPPKRDFFIWHIKINDDSDRESNFRTHNSNNLKLTEGRKYFLISLLYSVKKVGENAFSRQMHFRFARINSR